MKPKVLLAALITALATAGGACEVVERSRFEELLKEHEQAKLKIVGLEESLQKLQTTRAEQREQIRTLQGLGEKRLERLYHVTAIRLGRYTGGIDTDGKPGHEGIKVYLQPIDQHGSVIKAAGDVEIQLYDLAKPAEKNLIGKYTWPVDEAAKQWSSGFVTYHYGFVCPWKNEPPKHEEITVRVQFTDYLTGKTFAAQKLCKIKRPASAAPEGGQAN
ncbi:MAG: hypothetical protein ACYTF6_03995 [Planctomycetota bacterium]|jgi:hypothetical protein